MIFEGHVPDNDEAVFYAELTTIDSGGIDLVHMGETISSSFQGVDVVEVALAVLEEEFKHLDERVELVLKLGNYSVESLEDLGVLYLKASQLARQQEDANVRNEISFA